MVLHYMLPPAAGKTTIVNGRSYSASAGSVAASVPGFDREELEANGWINPAHGSGATTARPTTGLFPGYRYVDTTLGYIAVWDGVAWRNPATGAAV